MSGIEMHGTKVQIIWEMTKKNAKKFATTEKTAKRFGFFLGVLALQATNGRASREIIGKVGRKKRPTFFEYSTEKRTFASK